MPDLVFPPSILKRYKEFIVESALAINLPSFGKIPSGGSDLTLLGTVPIGILQATTYPIVTHYITGKISPGGKSGDGVTGFIIGLIRDVTKNPNPAANGTYPNGTPAPVTSAIDSSQLAGLFSGVAPATQEVINPFAFISAGLVAGNKLAYDVHFLRRGGAGIDPGLWVVNTFSATYAMLVFGPALIPPT